MSSHSRQQSTTSATNGRYSPGLAVTVRTISHNCVNRPTNPFPSFTRSPPWRFLSHNVTNNPRPHTARCRRHRMPKNRRFFVISSQKFVFRFEMRIDVNWFNRHQVDGFDEHSAGADLLCTLYHSDHRTFTTSRRRASDVRSALRTNNFIYWVFKLYYFSPEIQPMTAPITAERVSPAAPLRTLIIASPAPGACC